MSQQADKDLVESFARFESGKFIGSIRLSIQRGRIKVHARAFTSRDTR
jgi:hypothetical protein